MHDIISVRIGFEFGQIGDRAMTVTASCGSMTAIANKDHPTLEIADIHIPNSVKLRFSGKIPGKDTLVDAEGNITKDMYVKIISMSVDAFRIKDWVLEKKMRYRTDQGQEITSSYIGFNGVMTIDIPENNMFSFYQRLNRDE